MQQDQSHRIAAVEVPDLVNVSRWNNDTLRGSSTYMPIIAVPTGLPSGFSVTLRYVLTTNVDSTGNGVMPK
jgi:hypothetical protein